MALRLFTDAILKRQPIRVFSNGDMSRDFTFIDDKSWSTMITRDCHIDHRQKC